MRISCKPWIIAASTSKVYGRWWQGDRQKQITGNNGDEPTVKVIIIHEEVTQRKIKENVKTIEKIRVRKLRDRFAANMKYVINNDAREFKMFVDEEFGIKYKETKLDIEQS